LTELNRTVGSWQRRALLGAILVIFLTLKYIKFHLQADLFIILLVYVVFHVTSSYALVSSAALWVSYFQACKQGLNSAGFRRIPDPALSPWDPASLFGDPPSRLEDPLEFCSAQCHCWSSLIMTVTSMHLNFSFPHMGFW